MASNRDAKRGSSLAQMQAVLESQEAANEATRQAMSSISATMNGLMMSMDSMINPLGNASSPYGMGPNGGRPTMNGNQARGLRGQQDIYPGGHGYGASGLGAIRQSVMGAVESRVGVSSGSRFSKTYDSSGTHSGYIEHMTDGTTRERSLDDPQIEQDVQSSQSRHSRSNIINRFANNGLYKAAKAIPYVGEGLIAGEAVLQGAKFVASQREADAKYQSIYGGTNLGGLGQRFEQFGYSIGNLFGSGMSMSESDKAFQGVSALGIQGSARSSDLRLINKAYSNLGVSVSESLKMIQTAADGLNLSATNVYSSMKSVSNAARSQGMNAGVGRQILQNTYSSLTQSFSDPSGGVAALSGYLATAQTNLGRYADGINLQGMLANPAQLAVLAAQPGINQNLSQFGANVSLGSQSVARAIGQRIDSVNSINTNPQAQAYLRSAFARVKRDKDGHISSSDLDQIATEFAAASAQQNGGYNSDTQAGQFQTTGLNIDPNTAAGMTQANDLAVSSYAGKLGLIDFITNPNSINKEGVKGADWKNVKKQGGYLYSDQHLTNGRRGIRGRHHHGMTGSITNSANPVVQQAIDKLKADKVKKVYVQDAHGKTIQVSLSDAQKHYADQLALGTAQGVGQTYDVEQELGGIHQTSYNYNSAVEKQAGVSGTYALSGASTPGLNKIAAALQARNAGKTATPPSDNKGAVGTVTISPTHELLSLLNFATSGNVAMANANAAAGTVPGQ